jgi:hypothetical protein
MVTIARKLMTEIPKHLLQRAKQRRDTLEQKHQLVTTIRNTFDVSLPAGSGHVIKVVHAHQCCPPSELETQDLWGPGTLWECECGRRMELTSNHTWTDTTLAGGS